MDKSAFGVYSKPNFFELFLREHIDENLYKAFKFAIKALSTRYPENAVLDFVKRHKTCIYYGLLGVIEAHSLAQHSSTLSERFLGIQRVSSNSEKGVLAPLDIALSLCGILGVPLIFRHLRRTAKRYSAGEYFTEADEHGETLRARYARVVTILYPYLRAGSGLAALGYSVAYIGDLTRYASPSLHLAGLRLATERVQGSGGSGGGAGSSNGKGAGLLGALGKGLGDVLRLVLPLMAFGYRSLEWWYSIPESVAGTAGQESLPPAPEPPRVCSGVSLPPFDRCPLCGRKRTNPAVLAPSGFAFCYPCIVKYVREYSRCPVTGLPASEVQIRRLFVK